MPNTKSAKRKVKKVAKQALLNKFWKRRYKLAVKKMEANLKKNNKKEIQSYFSKFQSELMKAAKKGVVKKKSASRKISKISKKIKNLKK
tara:strand:- start:21032 stop:21298 length:267 start_codon:yes stop_codon:yes gene_type:complete